MHAYPSRHLTESRRQFPLPLKEEGETESEPRGEADLLIPSLSDEEYENAYKKKKLQKSVFFVSLVIILIIIGAGGIIFYEDISTRSLFQKSQPEIIPPSSPGEQAVNTIPPDESPKPQAEEEKTAPPPPPQQKSEVKPVQKAVYSVQIGAFKQEANAASLVRQLKDKGYSTWLYKGTISKGAPLYRVLIGKFEHEKDAKKHAETIHARENIPVILFKE